MKIDHRKAAVIGCGNVGASIAFRFLQQGLFTRLVLLDANRDKAEGEAMDLRDGLPYGAAMEISAGDYDDLTDCALAVITAGANQKPGETRLDLIGKNTEILRSVLKEVTARNFGGILLVVSNPDYIQLCLHGLGLFDGDNSVICHLLHGICHHIAHFIVSCGDGSHSCHLMLAGNLAAHGCNRLYCRIRCLLHTFSQNDRVRACCHILHTLVDHRLCQHRSSGCTIACHIVGLGRHFFYQLSAHILKCVFQLDLFCNRYAVVGDQRSAELFVKDHVPSLRSKGHAYGICKFIHTGFQCDSGVHAMFDFFSHD